jgi:uncharacterized protein (TIGR02996 family)
MDQEQAFLQAMLEEPRDLTVRLIFADWLDEHDDPRGELLRLSHHLTQETDQPYRKQMEDRLRALLEVGVQPVGPFGANAVGMHFAWIPPGVFLMGSPESEQGRILTETQHRVRLTKGLWLGAYPVTQAQWQAVMGYNPSRFQGGDLPVEQVSWEHCQEFCAALTQRDGGKYALPTEAEWEYACRAGTTTPFYFGESLNPTQANCRGGCPYESEEKTPLPLGSTTQVRSYRPNAWGLFDMHGNVWEWCVDCYDRDYYDKNADHAREIRDPVNHINDEQSSRVLRGGSFLCSAEDCRAANRRWNRVSNRVLDEGLRVALRLD